MNKARLWKVVSRWKVEENLFEEHLRIFKEVGKDRFLVFFRPDLSKIDTDNLSGKEASKLERAGKRGIGGLKISKVLGLTAKDKPGKVIPIDDHGLDPIWAKYGEFGISVVIHVSDPVDFQTPVDQFNEHYDELGVNSDWSYYGDQFPYSKNEIFS